MDESGQPSVEETVIVYRRFWTALLQAAEPVWSGLDLTISQLKGLIFLEARGEHSVSGIADALGMGRPSASILVEQLVQLGLVRRTEDSGDRRRALVALSPEGMDLTARFHRGDEQRMREMFAQLADGDLRALGQGLHALTEALVAPCNRLAAPKDTAHPGSL
jgi:DNA-binding MarR family transcriptional regulator